LASTAASHAVAVRRSRNDPALQLGRNGTVCGVADEIHASIRSYRGDHDERRGEPMKPKTTTLVSVDGAAP
jgi:hypothetical protein